MKVSRLEEVSVKIIKRILQTQIGRIYMLCTIIIAAWFGYQGYIMHDKPACNHLYVYAASLYRKPAVLPLYSLKEHALAGFLVSTLFGVSPGQS